MCSCVQFKSSSSLKQNTAVSIFEEVILYNLLTIRQRLIFVWSRMKGRQVLAWRPAFTGRSVSSCGLSDIPTWQSKSLFNALKQEPTGSRSCLQHRCNCQYKCHEASVLGPTRIPSLVFQKIQLLFAYLCHFRMFFRHIKYVNRSKCTNCLIWMWIICLFAFIALYHSSRSFLTSAFFSFCAGYSVPHLFISLHKYIPCFLRH
jgi:hypothetical protein